MANLIDGIKATKTIDRFKLLCDSDHPLLIDRLEKQGFSQREIATIIDIIDGLCPYCWDGENGCQCWNEVSRLREHGADD